jgi:peptide chain release factor 3
VADPIRAKQLRKGLLQLGEEGAIQVFRPETGGPLLLGAVGQLQFEVVAHRLEHEYGVKPRLTQSRYRIARWVTSTDADELKRFLRTNSHRVAVDVVDAPVFLAAHASELDVAKERWEGIRFHAMREHAGLVFQTGVFE